jgi:hypothetical protein
MADFEALWRMIRLLDEGRSIPPSIRILLADKVQTVSQLFERLKGARSVTAAYLLSDEALRQREAARRGSRSLSVLGVLFNLIDRVVENFRLDDTIADVYAFSEAAAYIRCLLMTAETGDQFGLEHPIGDIARALLRFGRPPPGDKKTTKRTGRGAPITLIPQVQRFFKELEAGMSEDKLDLSGVSGLLQQHLLTTPQFVPWEGRAVRNVVRPSARNWADPLSRADSAIREFHRMKESFSH